MSIPEVDLDENLWQLYLNDCQMKGLHPSVRDFQIWKQEEDYDSE